ncbi:MAG: winged helix-turn-helix transcriptional regulator, partial [Spirochaetales bacterium]|nr:winged helix-turn-helix transcriptional regulator [Spirochaetales bacterium]
MKKMHKTQREILAIIKEYGTEPWTIRDLQERLNISSPSLIFHHLQMLTRKGYIRRDPENHTSYQLLSEANDSIIYLDTYG